MVWSHLDFAKQLNQNHALHNTFIIQHPIHQALPLSLPYCLPNGLLIHPSRPVTNAPSSVKFSLQPPPSAVWQHGVSTIISWRCSCINHCSRGQQRAKYMPVLYICRSLRTPRRMLSDRTFNSDRKVLCVYWPIWPPLGPGAIEHLTCN